MWLFMRSYWCRSRSCLRCLGHFRCRSYFYIIISSIILLTIVFLNILILSFILIRLIICCIIRFVLRLLSRFFGHFRGCLWLLSRLGFRCYFRFFGRFRCRGCQCGVFRDGDVAFDGFASYIIGVVSDCFVGVAYDGAQGAVAYGGYDSGVVGAAVAVCVQKEQVAGFRCVAIRNCIVPCAAVAVLRYCACWYSCVV